MVVVHSLHLVAGRLLVRACPDVLRRVAVVCLDRTEMMRVALLVVCLGRMGKVACTAAAAVVVQHSSSAVVAVVAALDGMSRQLH